MRNRLPAAVLVAASCLSTAACGGDATSSAASTPPGAAAPAASAPANNGSGYPVTVENCGKKYTFAKAPSRVVVMSGGSVAEVSSLLALGLGDRIVANAQKYGASDEPGRAEAIAALPTGGVKLNDAMDIPREAILGLRPDFVLSTYGGGFSADSGFATRDDLAGVGANTYVPRATCGGPGSVDGTQSIEDSYAVLRDLGRIFGVSDRAEQLVAASKKQIADVEAKVAGTPTPKVMLIIPGMTMGAAEFSSIGANGIWNDIMAKAGATNAFGGTTKELFADLSKEQVAAAQVDAVIIVDFMNPDPVGEAAKLFQRFPQWEAAKNNRFVVLSDSVYLGPNNATGVDRLARALHPERF
ncbi:ABC transporter substrate-binding protein [Yinghuangia seranimata]|nr:ABC transporter substrate-binding protein [Yinghuangia seranimata]MDI2130865.1 ABC transporter substrate-binding protein [Yinghuangia seranimata]